MKTRAVWIAMIWALALGACSAPQEGAPPVAQTHEMKPSVPPPNVSPPSAPAAHASGTREVLGMEPAPVPVEREKRTADRSLDKNAAQSVGRMEPPAPKPEVRLGVMRQDMIAPIAPPPAADTAKYAAREENAVKRVEEAPVSTFSLDVDTASYANIRRFLSQGALPPKDAVRVEEMVNYFPYDYPRPTGDAPFAVHTELAVAPWNPDRTLLRIGVKGQDLAKETLPPANLVFLVDVSGSMSPPERLPLLKSSLKLLVDHLRAQDKVSLVTYASGTAVVLPATPGNEKTKIVQAIDALSAGGSTAGASGIALAYQQARSGFVQDGINRILLATDGDFNVGVSNTRELKQMVERNRETGISLSTLGFGTDNLNDHMMQELADAGNGAYSYIDNLMEGHKVLVNEMTSTLATIAQDVKVQIEFNPEQVAEYRLIGYEKRILAREDFNNDKVDAGDIGAGHTVTALYELTLKHAKPAVDTLRYGANRAEKTTVGFAAGKEMAFLKLRYKKPGQKTSLLIERPIPLQVQPAMRDASTEFRFATAVAGVGQLLRGGRYTGRWSWSDARALAAESVGEDRFGYRREFLRLIDLASALSPKMPVAPE